MQQAARMPVRGRAATLLPVVAFAGLAATPFILAFFSGGYFDESRLWALLGACAITLVVAITIKPLPRSGSGRLAVAGLWALAAWTGASIAWAPLRGAAFHDLQRVLLYALSFTAAIALLQSRARARSLEPIVALGCVGVIAYGLAGRLLPGLIHESHGVGADGRLDQPLTYWNAVGAMAAIGLVMCARLAGDGTRRTGLRIAAAAACPALGMGLYVTYSRGALGAAVAGLLVLLAASPDRRQLRALVLAACAAVAGAAAAAPFSLVASLDPGSHSQGVAALALLVAVTAAAGLLTRHVTRGELGARLETGPLRSRALRPLLAASIVAVLAGVVIATAASEHRSVSSNPATGAKAGRLVSLQSHRYSYWKVALGAFADHPIAGLGSGGFQVRWLERRKFKEAVLDAHSLYIETAAELGLIGILALAAWLGGVALAARSCLAADPVLAAGPLAGLVTWAGQAALDWLWEMPAVSLVALALAACLVACSARERPTQPAQPPRARPAPAPPRS